MIASFDGAYPEAIASGFASHHSFAPAKPSVCMSGIHFSICWR